ncbi:MAG: OFA family MFS transporter [Acidobacteria bacterium]|nr:OFA family MFS transporter [Acidobacteriota bacterium]
MFRPPRVNPPVRPAGRPARLLTTRPRESRLAQFFHTRGPTMNRWNVIIGGVLMNLALGVIYAWSVFVAPFEADFGWTRTDVSVVFTIAILSVGSWFVVAGFLQDRFGPRRVAAAGGILYALGFFLASQTDSLLWLYITFGAIAGAGNGFGYAIPIPVCSKWFPDRRGLAVGLVVGGYGAGSGIYGPLAREVLIPAYGWQGTMQISAAVFLVMTLVAAWLLKNPPEGYKPPSAAPAPAAGSAPPPAAPPGGGVGPGGVVPPGWVINKNRPPGP